MAEKTRRFSPYVYCSNNPINRIDPDGMLDDRYTVDEDGYHNRFIVFIFHTEIYISDQEFGTALEVYKAYASGNVEEVENEEANEPQKSNESENSSKADAGIGVLNEITNSIPIVGAVAKYSKGEIGGLELVGEWMSDLSPYKAVRLIKTATKVGSMLDEFSKGGTQNIKHEPEVIENAKNTLKDPNASKKDINKARKILQQQEKAGKLRNKQKRNSN